MKAIPSPDGRDRRIPTRTTRTGGRGRGARRSRHRAARDAARLGPRTSTRSDHRRGRRTRPRPSPTADSRTRTVAGADGARSSPRMRSRFHHPDRSLAKTRSPAGLQVGCQIDSSPLRPAIYRSPESKPSGASSATPQLAAVPRHPRKVPRQPRQSRPVGRDAGRGVEVAASGDDRAAPRSVERHDHELVHDVGDPARLRVTLPHPDPSCAVGRRRDRRRTDEGPRCPA